MASTSHSAPRSFDADQQLQSVSLKSLSLGVQRSHNLRISQRTIIHETVTLQGWPSRGGIIVLEHATPPDFDYLHLDPLGPPLRRNADQDAEDDFCQSLLRLGAIWWDSEARRDFVTKLEYGDEDALDAAAEDDSLRPSRRERGWVRVAWPSSPPDSLCVLACEKIIMGRDGSERLRPKYHGIVGLARSMDERFEVLKRMGGTVYAGIEEVVENNAFLRAWEEGHVGEKGGLAKVEFIDPKVYGGHEDDALGKFQCA